MTDDEIDAILIPILSPHWDLDRDLTVTECERVAFKAGMRRAAESEPILGGAA